MWYVTLHFCIIFLIPPSEAKLSSSFYTKEELSFVFKKPLIISKNATEKDLKCTWKRYEESINLNKNIEKSDTIESIKRYDWVMYKSIDYDNFEDLFNHLEMIKVIDFKYDKLCSNSIY